MTDKDELGGWGPKAWEQLAARVAGLEDAVKRVLGTPNGGANGAPDGPTFKDWTTFAGLVLVPIVLALISSGVLR